MVDKEQKAKLKNILRRYKDIKKGIASRVDYTISFNNDSKEIRHRINVRFDMGKSDKIVITVRDKYAWYLNKFLGVILESPQIKDAEQIFSNFITDAEDYGKYYHNDKDYLWEKYDWD